MTAYRLTAVARRDLETLVRALAREDLRAAERAVDELFATMEWLSGSPDVGPRRADLVAAPASAALASRVRTWDLRDWLLVYAGPDPDDLAGGAEPTTFLRVLETGRPRWV